MDFNIRINVCLLVKVTSLLSFFHQHSCQSSSSPLSLIQTTRITPSNESNTEDLPCSYVTGLVVGDQERIEYCCPRIVRSYEGRWARTGRRLTKYLENLREWKCPQFIEECERRLFDFTTFTTLVYDHFCDYSTFIDKCFVTINETYQKNKNDNDSLQGQVIESSGAETESYNSNFTDNKTKQLKTLVRLLHSSQLEFEDLQIPCVQVALYEAEGDNFGDYHEVVRVNLPSCEITWCGYDGDTLRDRVISVWTCMSSSCRAKMISIMVICGLLGLVITIVNLSVIVVYLQTPMLLHSQGVYKVSLAFADLLVGVVVFPSFISSLAMIMVSRHQHGEYRNVSGYEIINGSISENITTVRTRRPAGQFGDIFSRSYLNAVGFFTILSFSVSIYSLTVAGFDRLFAVYRPLKYRKDRAKYWAKRLCVGLWLLGILFSILPVFVHDLRYALSFSILVASGQDSAIVLYAIALAIPLLVMWIVNIVTLSFTKKHAKARRHLTIDSKKKTDSIETRLAKTLSIMVGVFTLSVVPAAIVAIVPLLTSSVHFDNPQKFKIPGALIHNAFEFIAVIILSCNSLWNFFIYSARNYEFKKAVRETYKRTAYKLGLVKCSSRFMVCARKTAASSRKKFSNFSTSAASSNTERKKSLFSTSIFTLTTRKANDLSSSESNSQITRQNVTTTADSGLNSKLDATVISSSNVGDTTIYSESQLQNPRSTQKVDVKDKSVNSTMATDDSIFQSFAIDANADRFYMSVMEDIEEEITVESETNKEKKEKAETKK